jgi:hypothetical protein
MRQLAILVGLGVGLGGCSFGIRTVPNDWKETEDVDCSTSLGRPAVDGFVGVLAAAIHPALAIPNAIAALYGITQVSRCSSAQSTREEYLKAEAEEEREDRVARRPPVAAPAPAADPDLDPAAGAPSETTDRLLAAEEALAQEVLRAERAAAAELDKQQQAQATRERRAWQALSADERRRWQSLPLRARRVVKQRAIDRIAAADHQEEKTRLARLRERVKVATEKRLAAARARVDEERRLADARRAMNEEQQRAAAELERKQQEERQRELDESHRQEEARRAAAE